MEELAERVNDLIRDRTYYGVREEVAERSGHKLIWSNGAGRWFVGHPGVKKGAEMELDANQVFVPGARARDLKYLAESGMLESLPLYGGSYERREMGTPDYAGVELPPYIKVVRDTNWPRERAVDEALRRKAGES